MRKTFLFKNKQKTVRAVILFLKSVIGSYYFSPIHRIKQKLNPMKQHHNDVKEELGAVRCVPLGVNLSTSDTCGFISVPL